MKTNDNTFKYMTVVVCIGIIIVIYIVACLLGDKIEDKVEVSAAKVSELFLNETKYYDVPLNHDIHDYIFEVGKHYNVRLELILAVIDVESSFREKVISRTQDYGLMNIAAHTRDFSHELAAGNICYTKTK